MLFPTVIIVVGHLGSFTTPAWPVERNTNRIGMLVISVEALNETKMADKSVDFRQFFQAVVAHNKTIGSGSAPHGMA